MLFIVSANPSPTPNTQKLRERLVSPKWAKPSWQTRQGQLQGPRGLSWVGVSSPGRPTLAAQLSPSPLEPQQSERADCLSPHFTERKTEVQKEEAIWEELFNGRRDLAWDSALSILLWCFLDSLLGPARPQA